MTTFIYSASDVRAGASFRADMSTIDPFIGQSLKEIRKERQADNKQLYVAAAIDTNDVVKLYEATGFLRDTLNYGGSKSVETGQSIVEARYYRVRKGGILKPFCSDEQLKTDSFFASMIASNDSLLTENELRREYEIVANCYHFRTGGAPKSKSKAIKWMERSTPVVASPTQALHRHMLA
jgi:hypothetical protein